MNNKYIKTLGFALMLGASFSVVSCVEEVFPMDDTITDEKLQESAAAAEGIVRGLSSNFNFASFFDSWADDGTHYVFGYGSIMHIRDLMTADMAENTTSYSHWYRWAQNQYQGQDYRYAQYYWNYYWGFVNQANAAISGIDAETANDAQLGSLGAALAYRALLYLDMGRMYECLPTDVTSCFNEDGNDVSGLTVPIVTEETSEADAADNPRVSHEKLAEFIETDLNLAEEYIVNLRSRENNTLPDLACVYGLKARLYMWNEDYAKAQVYARKAIEAGPAPIGRSNYLSTTNGFNTASDFMWASVQSSEDWTVQTGIINWTSWMSNQTAFGYTGTGTSLYNMIGASLYERMSDTDYRKLLFKAPAGSALSGKEAFLLPEQLESEDVPAYTALKFRPAQGNSEDYTTGAAAAYPIMRVEEMYFIEAEAAAHLSPSEGVRLVTEFMKNNRDPQYSTTAASDEDVIEEIIFQKRVELWGEGQTFFDIKRLNMSVTRGYPGTNFLTAQRFNTDGRPAWMNIVIVQTESNSNKALVGQNNPDPSDKYTPWTE